MYPFSLVPLRVKRKRGFREVNSQPGARRVVALLRDVPLLRGTGEEIHKKKGGREDEGVQRYVFYLTKTRL